MRNKEKDRAQYLKYREKHPDYFKNQSKKWYEDNKEHAKERSRKYNRDHPGHSSEQAKRWRAQNPEASKIQGKKYYSENREKELERKKKYGKDNPAHTRRAYLKKTYGITPEDFSLMKEIQGGRCAVCGAHYSDLKKDLCIDHNHDSGMVRGLLCSKCNSAIGLLNDDPRLLYSALMYITRSLQGDT